MNVKKEFGIVKKDANSILKEVVFKDLKQLYVYPTGH
jgi:hypothetical protein